MHVTGGRNIFVSLAPPLPRFIYLLPGLMMYIQLTKQYDNTFSDNLNIVSVTVQKIMSTENSIPKDFMNIHNGNESFWISLFQTDFWDDRFGYQQSIFDRICFKIISLSLKLTTCQITNRTLAYWGWFESTGFHLYQYEVNSIVITQFLLFHPINYELWTSNL